MSTVSLQDNISFEEQSIDESSLDIMVNGVVSKKIFSVKRIPEHKRKQLADARKDKADQKASLKVISQSMLDPSAPQ